MSSYTSLELIAVAGLLQSQGFVVPSRISQAVDQYNTIPLIATLLDVIEAATPYGLSGSTVESLQTFAANSCPALAANVPQSYADTVSPVWSQPIIPETVSGGFAQLVLDTATRYLGSGSLWKFCNYFIAQQGYRVQTNQLIYTAANSTTWLGDTFTSMNSLISAGITDISLALPALALDLADLGNAIDLASIDTLGTPAGLLQQISRQAGIVQGTIPCINDALVSNGFTEQEINDLATPDSDTSNRFTPNQYNTLQKRAYSVLQKIKGDCLATVLDILSVNSDSITAQNDQLNLSSLLDPKILFPRSYKTLTVPQGKDLIPIYNNDGSLNNAVAEVVENVSKSRFTTVNCDQLAKIVPADQAVASQAVAAAFLQVANIRNITLPDFTNIVNAIQTLKGLTLIDLLSQPVPQTVTDYYQNNLASGSGEFGTFLVQDFFGTLSGDPAVQLLNQTSTALNLIDTSILQDIYDQMLLTVQGTYGPAAGPVVITSGPGTGTYATADAAFTTSLIPLASAAIDILIISYPVETIAMNNCFNNICLQIVNEAANQNKTGINFDNTESNLQTSVTSFVSLLSSYAQDQSIGGAFSFLADLADFSSLYGQSILAAMREAINQTAISALGTSTYDIVPNSYPDSPMPDAISVADSEPPQIVLPEPEYQTINNPLSAQYAPSELTDSTAVSPQVDLLSAYQIDNNMPSQQIEILSPATGFFIKARIKPADTNSLVTTAQLVSDFVPSSPLSISIPVTAGDQEGFLISVPDWMVPQTGEVTFSLNVEYTLPTTTTVVAKQTFYVANVTPRTIVVTQPSWWKLENQVLPTQPSTLVFSGAPLESVNYDSPWGTGTATLDSNGTFSLLDLDTPPVGTYSITALFGSFGAVTQEFAVTEVAITPLEPANTGVITR